MSKFYAVRKGREVGIFKTWHECKELVTGYSGAQYKSFNTYEEATEYLTGKNVSLCDIIDFDVYVDGSCKDGKYSYGVVFVHGDIVTLEINGMDDHPEATLMRNVAGELLGTIKAVQHAKKMNVKICIHYDYTGIENWATGAWGTSNKHTAEYAKFMTDNAGIYTFKKVKSHSNNKYNDRADRLAKNALGID